MKKRTISIFTAVSLLFSVASWRIYDTVRTSDIPTAGDYTAYVLRLPEIRGNIYDRDLRKLVGVQTKYVAAVSPNVSTVNEINRKLGASSDAALELLKSGKPAFIEATADFKSEESLLFELPVRYSENQLAAHLIGYADMSGHGMVGIERAYDSLLTSDNGVTVTYTVDATGRPLSGVAPSVSGTTDIKTGVILTLDSEIQKTAEQAASGLPSGAVVVMDAANGDILAMCSTPAYSPLEVGASLNDSATPLVNRALSAYNVGSVFKILVASAALDSGISQFYQNTCTGSVQIGENVFGCSEHSGHGTVDMRAALSVSCNPYFISLASAVGGDEILELCKNLGFGDTRSLANGISSAAGTLPKASTLSLQPAALANFAFGQGDLLLTPVDVAVMTSMIANGGYAVKPRVVSGVMLADGSVTKYHTDKQRRVINETVANTVADMMRAVVLDGTGAAAMPENGGAGGKTATAEAGYTANGKKVNQCWFSGFYPAENPRYVITVLGENGVSGGSTCAPVFASICNSLYKLGIA